MSSWFSGGGAGGGSWQSSFDSLKNQVSSSLKEVVDSVAVDPSTLNPEDNNVENEFIEGEANRRNLSSVTSSTNHTQISDQLEVAVSEIARLQSIVDSQTKHIQQVTNENQRILIEKQNTEKQVKR